MPPNWLIAAILALFGAWRIKRSLRYRKSPSLFVSDTLEGRRVDRKKLTRAIRAYVYKESFLFFSLSSFAVVTYVQPLGPYLWPIGISILCIYVVLDFWWYREFST
jgi:hypothetical protein